MNRIYTALAKYFERRAGIHAHGSRTCSACHLRIRYTAERQAAP